MSYRTTDYYPAPAATQEKSPVPSGSEEQTKFPQVDFIGNSPAIREIYSMIQVVSDSTTAVLITGESGTGKDVVARLIHSKSPRADQPFIAINCAAVPRDVFENELFGHERGAFTGAITRKAGYLEMANNGTLFLDELAEMNPDTQAKLLRVIETKSYIRLGGTSEIKVDVRMLAATNKDVPAAIASGELRKDLYYRFSVLELRLPPLRERREDIPVLVDHFLISLCEKHNRPPKIFAEEVMDALMNYNWPGNIRELKNVVERAVLLSPADVVTLKYLPSEISKINVQRDHLVTIPLGTKLRSAEKDIILETLSSVDNNKSKAASVLGLSRKALYNKLRRFGAIK